MLRTHITSVEPLTIDTGHMVYTIIGCAFGTSEEVGNGYDLDGDGTDGLVSNFLDAVTVIEEFEENTAAKVALYFTVRLPSDAKSPRDDETFDSKITVEDDNGEAGLGGYCNLQGKLLKAGETYQAVYEADVFSDSETFEFKIADIILKIRTDELYYILK